MIEPAAYRMHGLANLEALLAHVDSAWKEVSASPEAKEAANDVGADPSILNRPSGDFFAVTAEATSGVSAADGVAIAVAFAPLANHIGKALWDMVVRRLRRRVAADVLVRRPRSSPKRKRR